MRVRLCISVITDWLFDKFGSGCFDLASCYRCNVVFLSGPNIPNACLAADTFRFAHYAMALISLFLMMSYKQSQAWRAWIMLTLIYSIYLFDEIAFCATHPVPNQLFLYFEPGLVLVISAIFLMLTELSNFQWKQLAHGKSEKDDNARNEKWKSFSSTEAHHEFCYFIKSKCQDMILTSTCPPSSRRCKHSQRSSPSRCCKAAATVAAAAMVGTHHQHVPLIRIE